MYKIAAEQLPCVFHVSARTVSTHALNIFGDHSYVMACRQTGFAMPCEGVLAERFDSVHVAHVGEILVIPHGDLLDLVGGAETVEEVDERDLAGKRSQVCHGGEIHHQMPAPEYKLFNYYGAPDADRVIIAMGSICDVAEEVIDSCPRLRGERRSTGCRPRGAGRTYHRSHGSRAWRDARG